MHLFITGGSGLTGPAVIADLLAAGHRVTGLARSDASASRLEALGASVHPGSLGDLDSLAAGARAADGVIHMAYGGDFSAPEAMQRQDVAAIEALGEALVGTGKPLIATSGTLVMAAGGPRTEHDPPDPDGLAPFRIAGERACLAFAARDVRASVVRLAPTVHGPGDYGFIPALIAAARRNGVSAYHGDGANRWPAVHRLDAARLFRSAVERAPAGSALHGAGESAVTIRSVADEVARGLGLETASLGREAFAEHLGNPFLAEAFMADVPVSAEWTKTTLGWTPQQPTLLADISGGDYLDPDASRRATSIWTS